MAIVIVAIVADFQPYPQWNGEVRTVYVLVRCLLALSTNELP